MNSPSSVDNANYFLLGLDRLVDFTTLGEYRVVFGDDDTGRAGASADRKSVSPEEIWATDIEWSSTSRSRGECYLPRARDRKLARQSVRG